VTTIMGRQCYTLVPLVQIKTVVHIYCHCCGLQKREEVKWWYLDPRHRAHLVDCRPVGQKGCELVLVGGVLM
jgi:hypothetical protein